MKGVGSQLCVRVAGTFWRDQSTNLLQFLWQSAALSAETVRNSEVQVAFGMQIHDARLYSNDDGC